EFVPAVACGKVHGAGLRGERIREPSQQVIAGEMTVGVVVFLESVQIEDHHDELAAAARGGELPVQLPLELTPVRESGQRVGQREGADLLEEAGVLDGDRDLVR